MLNSLLTTILSLKYKIVFVTHSRTSWSFSDDKTVNMDLDQDENLSSTQETFSVS